MASDGAAAPKKERFAPKVAVQLDPPKDDPIKVDYLLKCDGEEIEHHAMGMLTDTHQCRHERGLSDIRRY